jgi:hypothetical protein
MTNRYELPTDPKLAGKVIEAERASAEMGRVGSWLGSRENAIIYIAFIIILFSMVACLWLALADPTSPLKQDMAKAFAALAISTVGYMFGSNSRRGNGKP